MSCWFLLLALLFGLSAASINFTAVFEWENLEFVWPSEDFRKEAVRKGDYNKTKVLPHEHVVYGERVFISIDKSADYPTPFTLTWLPTTASSKSPKLNPYPSWRMHEKGNCTTMQGIRGIVADVCGRLWAIDRGNELCPAKLWIFDLTENDSVSLVHQFANEIASHTFSKRDLKSLVLDETPNDTLAYIPDSRSGNMIVFSLKEKVSWAVQIKDIRITSIALLPIKGKELVYLGLWDKPELYSVPLSELRMRGRKSALNPTLVGNKTAASYRMLMDNKGKLYFDLRNLNYIGTWDTTAPFKEEQIYKDERLTYYWYKFSFAFDACNNLWILTKDKGKTTNFRLLRGAVGVKSYLYNDLIAPKGCGRNPSSYPPKKYEPTTVKSTKLQQTSKTVPFQVSKDNSQTTVQVISTGKPQPEKKAFDESHFNITSICLVVFIVILCCIILWLALWVKGLKKTNNQMKMEIQEMSVFPSDNVVECEQLDDDNNYDDVAPPVASTSGQVEPATARPYSDPHIYEEVNPSPPGSELYLKLQD